MRYVKFSPYSLSNDTTGHIYNRLYSQHVYSVYEPEADCMLNRYEKLSSPVPHRSIVMLLKIQGYMEFMDKMELCKFIQHKIANTVLVNKIISPSVFLHAMTKYLRLLMNCTLYTLCHPPSQSLQSLNLS